MENTSMEPLNSETISNTSKNKDSQKEVSDQKTNKYVIFKLGDEEYGIDILKVQGIINFKNVTQLPNQKSFVVGVLNLRGNVIPIIDLAMRFGLPKANYDKYTVIINAEIHSRLNGLIVDNVSDVDSFKDAEIQEAPSMGHSVDTNFIKGMGKKGERLIILLDLEKVFSSEDVMNIQAKKEVGG